MIDPASPTPKKCGQVKLYILFAAILLSTIPAPFPATASEDPELVTNATVRELHEIGFGEEVILEKILNTQCEFAVDIDSLKQLKEAGVPSRVIAEMISTQSKATPPEVETDPNDPLSPHRPGIYIFRPDSLETALEKIEPSTYTQKKSGGFLKSTLTYGAIKAKSKAILAGAQAHTITDKNPTFYFYFEETETGLSSQNHGTMTGQRVYTNPGEFVLAQFKANKKKNNRELVVAKISAWGGVESGAIDETVRQIKYEKMAPGIYKVTPAKALESGEYCFYYGGSTTPIYGFWGTGSQVFDFSVRANP